MSPEPEVATKPKPKSMSARTRLLLLGVAVVLVLGGGGYYLHERHFEDTDDAQIDADITNVSPRVAGTIVAVHVVENQLLKVGDPIADIDPRDLLVALALAKASVAQAEAQLKAEDPSVSMTETTNVVSLANAGSDIASSQAALSAAKKEVQQLTAQLAQAQANNRNAQLERERSERLIKEGAIAQADFDEHQNAAAATQAAVDALAQSLAAAHDRIAEQEAHLAESQSHLSEVKTNAPRQVETRKASVIFRQASLDAAKAQLEQAELNLGYAHVLSPVAGIIGKKAVSVGDQVAPGQQLLAIAQTQAPWVTANYRETQLQRMQPGQSVEIHVDAINADLRGTVESIGGATGARFSVLPPENASGNYVKVVQRVPVRIKLDPGQAGMDRLRPGMSVEPSVRVD